MRSDLSDEEFRLKQEAIAYTLGRLLAQDRVRARRRLCRSGEPRVQGNRWKRKRETRQVFPMF